MTEVVHVGLSVAQRSFFTANRPRYKIRQTTTAHQETVAEAGQSWQAV